MNKRAIKFIVLATGIFAADAFAADIVSAQQVPGDGDIVVTARKRQESILNVPVVETALTRQTLDRLQVNDLKDIASLVPGLSFGDNDLSIGTQVSLRGVGTSANDPGVDQSVSLNIDGLSLSNGLAFMSGSFDLGQVEVLKGPQALFYGKSSPGGVISFRSADPTDQFEVIARGGYEFEARERRGELIVSGPLSSTLKARVAGFYSDSDGFFKNIVKGPLPTPASGYVGSDRLPAQTDWMIRGTLLWAPTDTFNARLKVNTVHDREEDAGALQLASCPTGTGPVFGFQFQNPTEDCHLDRKISLIELAPAAFPDLPRGGLGFTDTTQNYGTLELNFRPARDLTLTSTTAVYYLHSIDTLNGTSSTFAGPTIGVTNNFRRREITEEVRLNSDFSGPLNFTTGGFLERGRIYDDVGIYGDPFIGFPRRLSNGGNSVRIETESLFGQLRYKIVPQVELAAGARWTDETRTDHGFSDSESGEHIPVALPNPRINSKNLAPEITLTYKPVPDVTIFGSWKRAYKSGSFSIGTPPVASLDNSYHDEKVQGEEIGLKSRLFGRTLSLNLSAYNYRYSGLQVGAVQQVNGGVPITKIVNAGAAVVRGVEVELAYRPPFIPKFGLHADATYNHARFKSLVNIPCYGGQTATEGCDLVYSMAANDGVGGFTAQDRSGLPLVRSAKWQINFGFDWETPLGSGLMLVIANEQHFSTRMLTNLSLPYYQPTFVKSDLSLSLLGPDDRWEVALIGKNLNNEITTGTCLNFNGRAAAFPGTQQTGTNTSGLVGHDQIGCYMDRGREGWIRFTLHLKK